MKTSTCILFSFFLSLTSIQLTSQDLEVSGRTKIELMDRVLNENGNVVRQSDGTLAVRNYKIGDKAHGGLIFYIDESGEHGLVTDTMDTSNSMRWYAGLNGASQALGDGPYAGEMNTSIAISSMHILGLDGNDYAALICSKLQSGGFGDWYLPSKEELNLMYNNLHVMNLGRFADDFYWTSTEHNPGLVWTQNFTTGSQHQSMKSLPHRVRAIRAF